MVKDKAFLVRSMNNTWGVQLNLHVLLTLNIPSLGRQRCLPSWGPRRIPLVFF